MELDDTDPAAWARLGTATAETMEAVSGDLEELCEYLRTQQRS